MSATDPYVMYEGSSVEGDKNGHRSAVVVYRVPEARSAAEALARFDANPALRMHPDDTTIPFDSRSAFRVGPEYRVSARFSTFGGGDLAPSKPLDVPGWYSWDRGRRRVDVEIAYNIRERRVPGDDEAAAFEVWVLHKVKTPEIRPQRTLRVKITTENQSILDVIDGAIGDIHKLPDGRYWQLVNSETRPIDTKTWDVTYTWEYDEGTRYPMPMAGDTWEIASYDVTDVPIPYDPATYWRPPFCEIAVPIVPVDPRTTPFLVVFTLTGELNPDGWRALPGTEVL